MNSTHPLVQLIPALVKANCSATHRGLETLCSTIQSSGDDTWKTAVWDGIVDNYLNTVLAWAASRQLSTVFSKGFLFDVALSHGADGLDEIAQHVKGARPPSQGGDEATYMLAYLQARISLIVIDPSTNDGSPDRALMWKSILDKSNLTLQRPIHVTCYGEYFDLVDEPNTSSRSAEINPKH